MTDLSEYPFFKYLLPYATDTSTDTLIEILMIIDSHTHAWEYWPYEPPVPDHNSRGRVEQLLWEMDRNGVDKAVLVCARIEHNPHNNDYVAEQIRAYPDRLVQFADVDCSWSAEYHTPGAAERTQSGRGKVPAQGLYSLRQKRHRVVRVRRRARVFQRHGRSEPDRQLGLGAAVAASVARVGAALSVGDFSLSPHGWGQRA